MVSLGSFQGLVRSIALTFATIACLLTGVTRAQGVLRGPLWASAVAGVGALVLVAFASLFLAGGITYLLAAGCGYVIVARRVPWVAVITGTALIIVLHAGKGEMRAKYWSDRVNYGDAISLAQLPGLAVESDRRGRESDNRRERRPECASTGVDSAISCCWRRRPRLSRSGMSWGRPTLVFHQSSSPGLSNPGKPASQVSMDLLNIRYGLQSETAAESTAVGWGLITEGYANSGCLGVIGIGLLLGAFCAALANWSLGAKLGSPAIWMSAAAMMGLINVEADFISLVLPLLQSFGAVIMVYALFSVVVRNPTATRPRLQHDASLAGPAWEQRPMRSTLGSALKRRALNLLNRVLQPCEPAAGHSDGDASRGPAAGGPGAARSLRHAGLRRPAPASSDRPDTADGGDRGGRADLCEVWRARAE